jgi:hypothetical protein
LAGFGNEAGRVVGFDEREYKLCKIQRSGQIVETGLFADGKKGTWRLTDPVSRMKDLDGI